MLAVKTCIVEEPGNRIPGAMCGSQREGKNGDSTKAINSGGISTLSKVGTITWCPGSIK